MDEKNRVRQQIFDNPTGPNGMREEAVSGILFEIKNRDYGAESNRF